MARPMNLEKRMKALADLVTQTMAQSDRAYVLANDLKHGFKNATPVVKKKAEHASRVAATVAYRLEKVSHKLSL